MERLGAPYGLGFSANRSLTAIAERGFITCIQADFRIKVHTMISGRSDLGILLNPICIGETSHLSFPGPSRGI